MIFSPLSNFCPFPPPVSWYTLGEEIDLAREKKGFFPWELEATSSKLAGTSVTRDVVRRLMGWEDEGGEVGLGGERRGEGSG